MNNGQQRESSFWLPKDVKYRQIWLCLYQDEAGRYIGTPGERYLCAESFVQNDPIVEKKMQDAAKVYGIEGGKCIWTKGRKVSDMEADDQMERLLDGKIPDEREEVLDAIERAWMDKNMGGPVAED